MCAEAAVPTAAAGDARSPRVFRAAATGTETISTSTAESSAPPLRAFGTSVFDDLKPKERLAPDTARRKTKTRIRQHLNPLATRWQGTVKVSSDWYTRAFSKPSQPLLVDVGCGRGRFAERLAQSERTVNVLGLEIRAPLVDEGNARARKRKLGNLAFLACNANVSLRHVLQSAPDGALNAVLLQFCDPWFKKKHAKRRMVDAALVAVMYDALQEANVARPERRFVYLQTDVLPLAEEMRALFDGHHGFRRDETVAWSDDGWIPRGPFEEKTEREICVEQKRQPVYRAMYTLAPHGWEGGAADTGEAADGDEFKQLNSESEDGNHEQVHIFDD